MIYIKFFVVSDIHGFFDELKSALDEAGFDKDNHNHWIISCGDLLDRGRQPQEVIDFFKGIERKILVKGNHDTLFERLCKDEFPFSNDYSNGTMQTILDLSNNSFDGMYKEAYNKYRPLLNQMVNYFETKQYVFVHSAIPYWLADSWREASDEEWADAMWNNPFDFWEQIGIDGKIAVFGHWHTSYYNSPLCEFDNQADFGIAYGDGFIGLDACTVVSGKVNVFVMEDEFIND